MRIAATRVWRLRNLRVRRMQPTWRHLQVASSLPPSPVYALGVTTASARYKSSMPVEDDYDLIELPSQKTVPFLLADIGEGIAEVEVLQWFVAPGDVVKQFDKVCEVQSDKATVEITSRYDGVVHSVAKEEMVSVGSPLLHIVVEGDVPVSEPVVEATPPPNLNTAEHLPNLASSFSEPKCIPGLNVLSSSTTDLSSPTKVLTTPAVRRLTTEHSLDLNTIVGTGPKGRILKADVLQLLHESGKQDIRHKQTQDQSSDVEPVRDEKVAIRGYSRLMVAAMTESLSIPHMNYADEVNMNQALQARKLSGIKLSLLSFAIKAVSLAIADYPILNSSLHLDEMAITLHSQHNIGVAMDTPRGLAVPVVKDCQDKSILEISQELDRLKQAAADGGLGESDLKGATFTLSNIGAIGGTYMSPIVAAPQVAIGAMGKIQRLPRFISGEKMEVEEVNVMQISWGADHRVMDGATLARFSNRWKDLMENPMSMVFCMK